MASQTPVFIGSFENLMSADLNQLTPAFSGKKVVIYIPAYNCRSTIISVLRRIPAIENSAVLIVDNASTDGTCELVQAEVANGSFNLPIHCARSETNLGYAGSQKAAYRMLREVPSVEWVVMLHGDGQYEPEMISRLEPFMKTDTDLVYGCRSKSEPREETPWSTFIVIKTLSLIESLITGYFRKEWHSGFVMYRTRFLNRIDLSALTTTPHIDGNLLFVAGLLKASAKPVVIYKRYKELTVFEGADRRTYVFNVFKLMWKFRSMRPDDVLRKPEPKLSAPAKQERLAQPVAAEL